MSLIQLNPGYNLADKYQIIRELGKGGMGVVYLAQDKDTDSLCALKTYRSDLLNDHKILESFKKEILVWIQIDRHGCVLVARSVREFNGRLFVEMDYIHPDNFGRVSLLDHIRYQPYPLSRDDIFRWTIHMCDGMTHAKSQGLLIHKDIKPSNLLIGQQKVLKIADFGIAALSNASSSTETSQSEINQQIPSVTIRPGERGLVSGTPGYIPPEEFFGNKCDVRSDIYCYGLVMWQMVTGSLVPPFTPKHANGVDDYLRQTFVNQQKSRLKIPRGDFKLAIQKCLKLDPDERFADFEELGNFIRNIYRKKHRQGIWQRPKTPDTANDLSNRAKNLKAIGKRDDAHQLFKKALVIDPNNLSALNGLAIFLVEESRLQEALIYFSRALELDDGNATFWANKGNVLSSLGRYEEAIYCHQESLKLNPNLSRAETALAEDYYELGQFEKALSEIEISLKLNEHSANAWTWKGHILNSLRRPRDAVQSYLRALLIDENYTNALVDLGKTYSKLGEEELAQNCFDRVLRNDPTSRIALFGKAEHLIQTGKREEALAFFDRILASNPRFAFAYLAKGTNLLELKKYQNAEEMIKIAIDLGSNDLVTYYNYATALRALNRPTEALWAFNKVVELDDRQTDAWYWKATVEYKLDLLEDASNSLKIYLSLNPEEKNELHHTAKGMLKEIEESLQRS
ncbi:tetratricopeptide repeat protein [Pseudomonadota bacterium]